MTIEFWVNKQEPQSVAMWSDIIAVPRVGDQVCLDDVIYDVEGVLWNGMPQGFLGGVAVFLVKR